MAKRASLSSFASEKPTAAPPPATGEEKIRGQTLRLKESAWRQLKQMALEDGTASHALLIEAVNDLFRKKGKPPIA